MDIEIQRQIENSKFLASDNRFEEALSVLNDICGKSEGEQKEQIYFEMGKIHTALKQHAQAKDVLEKIKNNFSLKKLAADLLLDNYKQMGMYSGILGLYEEYKLAGDIPQKLAEYSVDSKIKLKKYKEAFEIIIQCIQKNVNSELLSGIAEEVYVKMIYDNIQNDVETAELAGIVDDKQYGLILKMYFFGTKTDIGEKELRERIIKHAVGKITIFCMELKKHKLALEIINYFTDGKTAVENLSEYRKIIYTDMINYMRELNISNKCSQVGKFFLETGPCVPEREKKVKNIMLNEYEISCRKVFLKSFPRTLRIILLNRCNLHCIMCADFNHENSFKMSDAEIDDLIEIMPYLENLRLQGGEVFFSGRLEEILDEADKNGVTVQILTNGLLLNEKIINKILDNGVKLLLSIDSPFKETYESIRIGADFKHLINNINMFNDIKKNKKSGSSISVNMVVMKRNYKQIADMIDFAHKYNFNELVLSPLQDKILDENCFEYDRNEDIMRELSDNKNLFDNLARQKGVVLSNKLPFIAGCADKNDCIVCADGNDIAEETEQNKLFCRSPFCEMYIVKDKCLPTCICPELNGAVQKNSAAQNSILQFWNSDAMTKYRENIISGNMYDLCPQNCISMENK